MNIIFNPLSNNALTESQLKNNDDIIFDLRGNNIFAKGVKFYGTDTHVEVLDVLNSKRTDAALSANMGRNLDLNKVPYNNQTREPNPPSKFGTIICPTNKSIQGDVPTDNGLLFRTNTGNVADLWISSDNNYIYKRQNNGIWQKIGAGYADSIDWSNITNAPNTLPNPESLTIFDVPYNGSKQVTITPNNYIYKVAKADIGTNPITDGMAFIGTYYEPSNHVESVSNTPLRYSAKDIWDSWLEPKIENWYETQDSKVNATLWGNKFTGTGNISSSLYLSDGSQIYVNNTEILNYKGNVLYVGQGTKSKDNRTYIYSGKGITLYTQSNKQFEITTSAISMSLPVYASSTMNVTNGLYLSSYKIGKLNNTTQSYTDPWQASGADFRFGGSLAATKIYASQGFYHPNYDSTTGEIYLLTANGGIVTVNQIRSAIYVEQNNSRNGSYPLIWADEANTSNQYNTCLYKSYDKLTFNPSTSSLTVGGSVVASSFVKSGGTSQQLLRADGGIATFNWLGQSGQPTWLWGGNNQHSYYVYNPSNFRVAYATSAGNADTLDGTHLSGIFTAFGNNGHNITATIGGVTKSFLVNWAADSDKLDGYHASGLLTSVTNTNNGISVTVGGTTKSISNISVNYANSAGSVAWDNVTGKPSTFAPSAHTHKWADITDHITKLSQLTNDKGFVTGSVNGNTITINGSSTTWSDTWRPITDDYELGESGTSLSSFGSLTLYNDLLGAIPNPTNYYWANNKITSTSKIDAEVRVKNLGAGCSTTIENTIMATNWIRAMGDTGIYFQNHGGGLYMSDNTWIRTWGGKALRVDNTIRSTDFHTTHYANNVWTIASAAKLENSTTLVYGTDTPLKSINTYLRGANVTLQVKKGTSTNYNALQLTSDRINCNNFCNMKCGAEVSGGNFTVQNNAYLAQKAGAKVGIGTGSPQTALDIRSNEIAPLSVNGAIRLATNPNGAYYYQPICVAIGGIDSAPSGYEIYCNTNITHDIGDHSTTIIFNDIPAFQNEIRNYILSITNLTNSNDMQFRLESHQNKLLLMIYNMITYSVNIRFIIYKCKEDLKKYPFP